MSTSSEVEFQNILDQISLPVNRNRSFLKYLIAIVAVIALTSLIYSFIDNSSTPAYIKNYPITLRIQLTSHLNSPKDSSEFTRASLYNETKVVLPDVLIRPTLQSSSLFIIRLKSKDLEKILPQLKSNASLRALPPIRHMRNNYEILF